LFMKTQAIQMIGKQRAFLTERIILFFMYIGK